MSRAQADSFEVILAGLAAGLLNVDPGSFDDEMVRALEALVDYLGVDRSSLVQARPDGQHRITHTYALPGVERVPLIGIEDRFPWALDRLRAGHPFILETLGDLPPEAEVDRESLEAFGNQSIAAFPIRTRSRFLGIVAFGGIRRSRTWPPKLVTRMELVAAVLAGALLRHQRDTELQQALAEVSELKQRLEAENSALIEEVSSNLGFDDIVGNSPALRRALAQVEQVAPTDSTVLITGETGTGKELVARAIHRVSGRRDRPFVKVDCGALPPSIVESELFGHAKGAFTGAIARRTGRFELARGGTVFLDEIGELPIELQTRLLRVLEEGEFEPVGSSQTLQSEARVVAATNRNLKEAVQQGAFRADLYYRLTVFPIELPPLRRRREDIPSIALYLIDELARELGKPAPPVPTSALERLAAYDWPGNVRELRNTIERAMILSDGVRIRFPILSGPAGLEPARSAETVSEPRPLRAIEREHIVGTLEWCGWKVAGPGGAAETLDMHPSTLRSRIKKLGIRRPPASPRERREQEQQRRLADEEHHAKHGEVYLA